jgi:hypothetical protein
MGAQGVARASVFASDFWQNRRYEDASSQVRESPRPGREQEPRRAAAAYLRLRQCFHGVLGACAQGKKRGSTISFLPGFFSLPCTTARRLASDTATA